MLAAGDGKDRREAAGDDRDGEAGSPARRLTVRFMKRCIEMRTRRFTV